MTRALQLDPDFAEASLYLMLTPTWPDNDARVHFAQAATHRGRMSARDVAILDAYAPAMQTPPNLPETAVRLRKAHERFLPEWMEG